MESQMVTLTTRQVDDLIVALELGKKSARNNKDFNRIRKQLLILKKKQRYDLLHNRKSL